MKTLNLRSLSVILVFIISISFLIVSYNNSRIVNEPSPETEKENELRIAVTYEVLSNDTEIWPHPIPEKDILALINMTEYEVNKHAEVQNASTRFKLVPMKIMYYQPNPPGLDELKALHEQGISLVVGHDFSMALRYSYTYAHENNILMLSPTSRYWGPEPLGDYLFTLRPNTYSEVFADMITDLGYKKTVVFWSGHEHWLPLLESVSERLGYITSETTVVYNIYDPETYSYYLEKTAEKIRNLLEEYSSDEVCLLFDTMIDPVEVPNILQSAREFPELSLIRWFDFAGSSEEVVVEEGSDTLFAEHGLVQIIRSVSDNPKSHNFTEKYLKNVGPLPLPSRVYDQAARYDAIWLIAKTVLECGTANSTVVREKLPEVAGNYVGVIGSCRLENGERCLADYRVYEWCTVGDGVVFSEIGRFDSSDDVFYWYDDK
jgi:hypothetical protein